MKRLFVVVAIAFCTDTASAQEDVAAGRTYELTHDIAIREVTADGIGLNPPAPPIASPPPPSQFTVIRTRGDSAIIRFWRYSNDADYNKYNYDPVTKTTRYFAVHRSEVSVASISFNSRSWWPSVSAGAILVPIKMRAEPFDFSKDITLGPSMALRWRTTNRVDQFVSLVGSFGLTSVQLDSSSTEGQVPQPLDVSAVTPALGLVYEVDNFQFGVFVGWDMISDNRRLKWEYQGDRWFSIGMGYSIFARTSTRQAVSGKQQ